MTGSASRPHRRVIAAGDGAAPMRRCAGLLLVGRVQGIGRAVSHVDARCIQGAARGHRLLSTGVKAAAFAAFVRVFLSAFNRCETWAPVIWVVAAAAIPSAPWSEWLEQRQADARYSSIAHGGYLLLALVSANDVGKGAVLFYLLTYAITNLGAFGVIALLDNADRPNDRVSDYAGLWSDHPALAALMTIFLLSLGGFPPLGGFIAKWYVFSAAVKAGYYWLAIIGVLTSVISVFFYLRIVVMMYMTPSSEMPVRFPEVPRIAGAALLVSAILVLPRHPARARARLGRRVDLRRSSSRFVQRRDRGGREKNPNDFSACSASSAFKRRLRLKPDTYSAKEVANVFRQQFRFFGRGEMSPARHVRPALHVVATLDPRSGRKWGLPGKEGDRTGHANLFTLLKMQRRVLAFEVQTAGGMDRLGHPVERHIAQQLIFGKSALHVSAAVRPVAEFLHDPGGQGRRRVIQTVGSGQRRGSLEM